MITNSLVISKHDLTSLRKRWSEIIESYFVEYYSSLKLGLGKEIIEINESAFSHKYNRGRILRR